MHGYQHYATISATDLSNVDFDQVGEKDETTIRYNLAQTEFVLKWNATPTFVDDGTITPIATTDHDQAVQLMSTPEWQEPEPEPEE